MIRVVRPQSDSRHRRDANPAALLGLLDHPKAFIPAQPLDPLVVDAESLTPQEGGHPSIAIAGTGPGQLPQSGSEDLFFVGWHRGTPALGGSRLSDGPTRTTLGDRQAIHEHRNRLAAACRAHQFPFATSFKATMSRAWSATMCLSRAFSFSSSFSFLASSAFIPPY